MKLILYIAIIIYYQTTFSQNAFLNYYNSEISTSYQLFEKSNQITELSDGYLIFGFRELNYTGLNNDTTYPMLIKIDKQGNLVYNKIYRNQTCFAISNNYVINGDEIITVGNSLMPGDSCGFSPNGYVVDAQAFIQRININNGNLIWKKTFGESLNKTAQSLSDISKTNDNNFFIIGTDNNFPWLIKINNIGDTLFTKKYLGLKYVDFTNIYNFNGSIRLIAKTANTTSLYELDNNFNLTLIKQFNFSAVAIAKSPIQNNLIFTYQYKPDTRNFTIINEIDFNGNSIIKDTFQLLAENAVCKSNNNSFIIANKDFAKVSSKNNIVWNKRFFGVNNLTPWYYFLNIIQTSDNGFIGVGFYNKYTFVVKTDCNSNLEWDYNSCLLPTNQNDIIFPNPFTDNLTIQLPNINPETDNVTININNLLGQIIYSRDFSSQNIISLNTSTFSKSIYICSIFINKKFYSVKKIIKN
ncbi:MAG: T9SS type A sorting domain-containing protein [Bacteroidota bacterium]